MAIEDCQKTASIPVHHLFIVKIEIITFENEIPITSDFYESDIFNIRSPLMFVHDYFLVLEYHSKTFRKLFKNLILE